MNILKIIIIALAGVLPATILIAVGVGDALDAKRNPKESKQDYIQNNRRLYGVVDKEGNSMDRHEVYTVGYKSLGFQEIGD